MPKQEQLMRQVILKSKPDENKSERVLTTWVEDDGRIKKGVLLTLKGDDTLWRVHEAYSNVVPFSAIDSHEGWNNNI